MPLSFMNPSLLFGAAAAALPIIIHFLSRRRVRRLPFSDLRFLDEVQSRQARSLGIRRWLLLLLRVLAILLVALAAAGPRSDRRVTSPSKGIYASSRPTGSTPIGTRGPCPRSSGSTS